MSGSEGEDEPVELRCLIALRDARASFFNDIVAHAGTHRAGPLNDAEVADLRSEEVLQIAEFYYLMDHYGFSNGPKVRAFLLRHNDDIREFIKDKTLRTAQGLSISRLEECLFSDIQIEKVVHEISDGKLRLDQADLGRLLAPCMSPETTRKAVICLAKNGLLRRLKIGRVLILSDGTLEHYFEKHLQCVVASVRAAIEEEGAGNERVVRAVCRDHSADQHNS